MSPTLLHFPEPVMPGHAEAAPCGCCHGHSCWERGGAQAARPVLNTDPVPLLCPRADNTFLLFDYNDWWVIFNCMAFFLHLLSAKAPP